MIRSLAAVCLGALAFAAAFPKIGLHGLAWVGVVPLLIAVRQGGAWRAWWLGVAFGAVWRAGTLYWLVYAMTRFGGLSLPVALLGTTAVVGYLAVYGGIFAVLVRGLEPARSTTPLAIAAVWTGLELVQAHLFSGFPWMLVGYAGGATSILAQPADLFGVYGLSFLVVAVNAALAAVMLEPARWRGPMPTALVLLVLALGYGGARLVSAPAAGTPPADGIEIALVQGNVAQDRKWETEARERILQDHLRLTDQGASAGADLVIWPESSWPDPYGLEGNPMARQGIERLASEHAVAILVGTVRVHEEGAELAVANAALLFDADGELRGGYEKVRLVPFGEYLPLRGILGFLGPLVQAVGELRPGDPEQELPAAPRAGVPPFAVAICYEVIFPGLIRDRVLDGAAFLTTITNDAWYGTTSAPYQHFVMARMRAVETRRWLVRAANTGISGIVDPWGRVVERTGLFTEALVRGRIAPRSGLSLYTRIGDLFAVGCLVLTGVLAASLLVGRKRRS